MKDDMAKVRENLLKTMDGILEGEVDPSAANSIALTSSEFNKNTRMSWDHFQELLDHVDEEERKYYVRAYLDGCFE